MSGALAPGVDKARPLPGAGPLGLSLLLLSLAVLFGSSLVAYFFVRASVGEWPPRGLPPLPPLLWAATATLLLVSLLVHLALSAARRDAQARLVTCLFAAAGLGTVFLGLQALNWWEYQAPLVAARARDDLGGIRWLGQFYVLTALHALHVVAGLIPLWVTAVRARAGRYGPDRRDGPLLCAMYWHFLDAVWLVIFGVLLLF